MGYEIQQTDCIRGSYPFLTASFPFSAVSASGAGDASSPPRAAAVCCERSCLLLSICLRMVVTVQKGSRLQNQVLFLELVFLVPVRKC